MALKQTTLDRIRVMNKRFTNKLLIHIAGKKMGHFAILTHKGRKTGTTYRIPIIAEPTQSGFIIALTYGKRVDWLENVLAADGCGLRWKNEDYELNQPVLIDPQAAFPFFPKLIQAGLRKMGIQYFLKLEDVHHA